MLILKQPLNYGGRLYEIGENVRGKLPLDFIQELQESGHLEEREEEKLEDEVEALSEDLKSQRGSKRG
ncbi:hypothetical protein BSK54_07955 [Paenibacillus odorifer]|jgi:signal-transduction protein with cAMP-binding, CBS, and nucleotidyltransferase domain|uniref:hypothetical protein n=1 Tax=Paenibacillus odorifer TaxID=189426 RepID=UPI00096C7A10|nr:hypothetical protein [Paenibacillus odorifer]OME03376.1 hypothetical protein BSK54_07955 [Paenibacillus odorifer]